MSDDENYKVGPGKPPREFQFKKGQSGYPEGRPPQVPSIEKALAKVLRKMVKAKDAQGNVIQLPMSEAIPAMIGQDAMKGDAAARKLLLKLWMDMPRGATEPATSDVLSSDDREVLARHGATSDGPNEPESGREVEIALKSDGVTIKCSLLTPEEVEGIVQLAEESEAFSLFNAGNDRDGAAVIELIHQEIAKLHPPAPHRHIGIQEGYSATLIKADGTIEYRTG